jgi:hypothetical protein
MQISANGISLEVEDHGPPSGEPLLLIIGLGTHLLGWHVDFVAALVQRGFRVIRLQRASPSPHILGKEPNQDAVFSGRGFSGGFHAERP